MAKSCITFDSRDHEHEVWMKADAALTKTKLVSGEVLTVEDLDPDGFLMSIAYVAPLGFYISMLSRKERERIAADTSLPDDRIEVVIADEQEVPRCVLVGDDLARRIIREFCQTGRRSLACQWVDPFSVVS